MLLDPTQQAYLFEPGAIMPLDPSIYQHDAQVAEYRKQRRREAFMLNALGGAICFLMLCMLSLVGLAIYQAATLP